MENTVALMSAEDFAKKLGDSGLLAPAEIQDAMDTLSRGSSTPTGVALAEQLVSAGKLTSFQASAVLERRPHELTIGNYEVIERLGAGAMGTVYKARHRRMKRIVAIKVLSREVAKPAFIQRFQREVETLARLTHPNIIMAYDADEDEIGHFLVMEFVKGRDLATIVQETGRLPLDRAVDMIEQAARGLEYAHSKGIIHRDVKPANIMCDESGVVKVADLGLARLEAAADAIEATALTQAGTIVGTVDYMPPEQAVDSTTIDHRADIYSLGCTLYFVLAGQPPYRGSSVMAVLLKHRDGPIANVRDLLPDAPPELDALLHGMMAKKPEARIDSMSAVIRALERIKAGRAHSERASAAEQSIASLTVILVEPSRVQAGIIRKYLHELGIDNVHLAVSGKQALELASPHEVHVLISSMHLDDMTGVGLARHIRADESYANLGFILTTSGSEAEDMAALRSMPNTVLMSKPFDAQKLAKALAEATGRRLSK
jgi:serine/threonine protein kinase